MTTYRFAGRIAGVGTASGVRLVLGMWNTSPFGRFADVMIEEADGHRILLAPSDEIAQFVSTTYTFDETRIVPVAWTNTAEGIRLSASRLEARLTVGSISPLGRVLRIVPARIATHPVWLRFVDPFARVLAPGTRTAGSAGNGRREFYGVTRVRRITDVSISWHDRDLGSLAPVSPAVRFGFSSMPAAPAVVDVVTTIR